MGLGLHLAGPWRGGGGGGGIPSLRAWSHFYLAVETQCVNMVGAQYVC